MDESLPKRRIIRRRDEIDRLYHAGKRVSGPSVVLSYIRAATPDYRVAITCGRNVGNAVTRNLCRRRIREIVRRKPDSWKSFDVLVIVRRKAAQLTFQELQEELVSLSGKMHR